MKCHLAFFNCGENIKPPVLMQLSHDIVNYLEPSKNAQYYFPLQLVICDEFTKPKQKN